MTTLLAETALRADEALFHDAFREQRLRLSIVQGAFLPVPALRGGAVEKVWDALGQEFVKQGHEVLHVSRLCDGLSAFEERGGVAHYRVSGFDAPKSLAKLKAFDLLYSFRALAQLNRLPPGDIVVTNTFWLPVLLQRFDPKRTRGRIYVHVARYPRGQMRLYSKADRLQTVSRPIAEVIQNEAPALGAQVRVVAYPLPFEPDAFVPRKTGATGMSPQLLYVGRIHPEKGLSLLLTAFDLLKKVHPQAKLRVVGPFEDRHGGGGVSYWEQLGSIAQKMGDSVCLTGPIFDGAVLRSEYRRADLFVYPSLAAKGETFGLAPLEAMGSGCAAVVSGLECFRDFIVPNVNGYVFDHTATNPAQELFQALRYAIADPERETKRQAASATAHEYRLTRIARHYLDDFALVCQGAKRA